MPVTHTDISVDRVTGLIEAYGGNPQSWPVQERDAAIKLVKSSPLLQRQIYEAEQLDEMLLARPVDEIVDEALLARIVDNLPEQPVVSDVVVKPGRLQYWPTAIAAAVTGVAIMLVVMNGPQQEMQHEQLALQEIDYWLWQDVTDQVSFDSSEELPTDFMSML